MALSAKLAMRQGQAMVLTPQLLQAIKLLQMPNSELAAFIENELERNPLLDRADDRPSPEAPAAEPPTPDMDVTAGDWASENLESDPAALAQNLGTEIENAFGPDRAATPAERAPTDEGQSLSATSWTGLSGRGSSDSAPDIEAYLAETETLSAHLTRQAMIVLADPVDRLIARSLIDEVDEAGYFSGTLEETAAGLGAPLARTEAVLARLQTLEPTGVFARNLAECLALQLIERNRYDPAMRALIGLLDLRWRRAVADRNPVRHWHRGRVVLVGDAAHAPLQSYAQGAGMAIEDGLCLGELMAEEGDFTTAFKRFEAARILRTARLQLESRSLWDFYHLDEGIARDVRNATVADWDEAHLFDCLAWLYDGAPIVTSPGH